MMASGGDQQHCRIGCCTIRHAVVRQKTFQYHYVLGQKNGREGGSVFRLFVMPIALVLVIVLRIAPHSDIGWHHEVEHNKRCDMIAAAVRTHLATPPCEIRRGIGAGFGHGTDDTQQQPLLRPVDGTCSGHVV